MRCSISCNSLSNAVVYGPAGYGSQQSQGSLSQALSAAFSVQGIGREIPRPQNHPSTKLRHAMRPCLPQMGPHLPRFPVALSQLLTSRAKHSAERLNAPEAADIEGVKTKQASSLNTAKRQAPLGPTDHAVLILYMSVDNI